MGFKQHPIWVRFFGSKQSEVRDKQVPAYLTQESKETQTITATPPNPTVKVELELPQEHALNRLCDIRVQLADKIADAGEGFPGIYKALE